MLRSDLKQLIGKPKTLEQAQSVIDLLLDTVQAQQAELDAIHDQRTTNSRNSSKPPSSDSPRERAQRPPSKSGSGRKRGGQPGHKGHYRRLYPEDQVHEVRHWYPGQCHCGGAVALSGKAPHRYQTTELPISQIHVTEHQLHHGHCSACGASNTARLPERFSRTAFGPNLHATVALLSTQFHLSDRLIKDYLQAFWSLPISLGSISQLQGRMTPWLWPLAEEVRCHLRQQDWVHADETSHWRETAMWWMWVMARPEAAYYQVHASRNKGAAKNLLGDDYQGILISDRHGAYRVIKDERRQLCLPHLIRNFRQLQQRRGIDAHIGKKIVSSLQLLIRLDHRRQAGLLFKEFRRRCLRVKTRLLKLVNLGIKVCRKKSRRQCELLLPDIDSVFTFLGYPGLPLTNNEAERAIRPHVIWRKLSYSSKSARGDRFRAGMLTIIETCKRQGLSALQVVRETCQQGLSGQSITTSAFARHAVRVVA